MPLPYEFSLPEMQAFDIVVTSNKMSTEQPEKVTQDQNTHCRFSSQDLLELPEQSSKGQYLRQDKL